MSFKILSSLGKFTIFLTIIALLVISIVTLGLGGTAQIVTIFLFPSAFVTAYYGFQVQIITSLLRSNNSFLKWVGKAIIKQSYKPEDEKDYENCIDKSLSNEENMIRFFKAKKGVK